MLALGLGVEMMSTADIRVEGRGRGFKIAEYVTFLHHYSFQEGSRGWFVVR
jgi:hypothetical protein